MYRTIMPSVHKYVLIKCFFELQNKMRRDLTVLPVITASLVPAFLISLMSSSEHSELTEAASKIEEDGVFILY